MNNHIRKKPMHNNGGGYNNQPRRHNNNFRPNNGGGGSGGNRPRKNYPQLREKYLQQARDALASGDRVLAENYFQHADHCYRMMMEEGTHRPRPQQPRENADGTVNQEEQQQQTMQEEEAPAASALPAFLTMPQNNPPSEAPPAQDWEDRDNN